MSAPWEDSGVIYVYNGDANLKDKIRPVVSQKITMQLFAHDILKKNADVQTLGFSISEPVDIDGNRLIDYYASLY